MSGDYLFPFGTTDPAPCRVQFTALVGYKPGMMAERAAQSRMYVEDQRWIAAVHNPPPVQKEPAKVLTLVPVDVPDGG